MDDCLPSKMASATSAGTEGVDPFADLHPPLGKLKAMTEASRCLYCYDAPCVRACPTAIDVPKFIHQIRSSHLAGAARTILTANIMGGTCARACPTEILCEQACVLNAGEGAPVKIGALQRHAVDHLLAQGGPHPFKRAAATGKHIAVVGAGPAGLACAHKAAMLGHEVTVFEARPKPGGLNEYGLAAYKMVDDFAQQEVAFLLGIGGITIEYGRRLGRDLTLEELRAGHDAVFLGVGLSKANRLGLPGEDLKGVGDALSFIAALRQAKDKTKLGVGRRVVVIGGGNTAIDAAVQAKRLGAETVTLLYRRGAQDMAATRWEQDLARTEGVVISLWRRPLGFLGKAHVEAVRVERMMAQNGALASTGEEEDLPAEEVLIAVGQGMERTGLEPLRVENGKLWVDDNGQTSLPGVFAGGDCIAKGADLTVQAVEDGKRAAHAINAYLKPHASGGGYG
ncbi:MAG: NAD(P)-dependent oxidoreductase [Pseudomonadota bacterium]